MDNDKQANDSAHRKDVKARSCGLLAAVLLTTICLIGSMSLAGGFGKQISQMVVLTLAIILLLLATLLLAVFIYWVAYYAVKGAPDRDGRETQDN